MNKKIYTSNYARNGSNPHSVSISRLPPDWYTGSNIGKLAPTWELVMGHKHKTMSNEEYIDKYLALLSSRKICAEELVASLPHNTILLCYESPTSFCHRFILSAWVQDECGFCIPEWKNDKERKESEQRDVVESLLSF